MNKDLVIGLEIHVQLETQSKLFSSSPSKGCDDPNSNVNYFDLAIPGTLPRLNQGVIEKAIEVGHALNCKVNSYSEFDRKHYFYPDSPFNYQITQFYNPICTGGYLEVFGRKIKIHHFHLETDAGKMIHSGNASLLDFNRVGVPLIEIVTEPDLHSPEEFKEFIHELILKLNYLGINCNMELGNFRMDVNLSVTRNNKLGTRTEIKNLNSVKFAIEAIQCEYARHVEVLNSGGVIEEETKGYDPDTKKTFLMRSKNSVLDYRYVPDYNIPPLNISQELIDKIKSQMPEMPDEKRKRYEKVGSETREVIITNQKLANFFDEASANLQDINGAANLIANDLLFLCKQEDIEIWNCKVTPSHINELVKLQEKNVISSKTVRHVLKVCFANGDSPESIVKKEGLVKITDKNILEKMIHKVLENESDSINKYLGGDEKILMYFFGKIMKLSSAKADPIITRKLLIEILLSHQNK